MRRRAALGVLGASSYSLLAQRGRMLSQKRSQDAMMAASQVETLQKSTGKNSGEVMLDLLPAAQKLSRPPISNYRVGAVVRGASGDLYLGANLEIPGQPLNFSVHAEQAACSNAYMRGEAGITGVAVTAAPCGHCRQFLQELAPSGELEILVTGQAPVPLRTLLPAAFGPKDLGFTAGAFPIRKAGLTLLRKADPLTEAALSAASISYAPYTKAPAGLAILLKDGSIHRGAYIENVAFNPSLPPLQVALIAVINTGHSFAEIQEVTLVELEHAAISQQSVADATLGSIVRGVRLRRELARRD